MDNNIGKALWIGVGILFFIAVVSLGLSLLDQGRGIAQEQSGNLAEMQKRLNEAKFDMYDNQDVTGAQVLAAIKSFREAKDIFAIQVTTNKGMTTYLNNASFSGGNVTIGTAASDSAIENSIKNARNQAQLTYINPVADFDAQIRKDANGVICGIVFNQN